MWKKIKSLKDTKWLKGEKAERIGVVLFLVFIFGFCTLTAAKTTFNSAPDEEMKYDVCYYVYEHSELPDGRDETIRNEKWGISYGFTPAVSYAISGYLMKMVAPFRDTLFALVFAARMVSVVCITGYAFMCVKIAKRLFRGGFRWLFVALATLLPQVLYLGTYINNDSMALLATALIVYAWIVGLQEKWNLKACIWLGVGISVCALSYYNAYGFILASLIIYCVSCYFYKMRFTEFLKKGGIIAGIVLALAGWWFIRNAVLYNGDFLALDVQREYGEMYAIDALKPSNRPTPAKMGVSLGEMLFGQYGNMNWISYTAKSFVGGFEHMNVFVSDYLLAFYYQLGIWGIVGCVWKLVGWCKGRFKKGGGLTLEEKNKWLFVAMLLICIVTPIALSMYYSYFSDYEPQGRYIMPMMIPLALFLTWGFKKMMEKAMKKAYIPRLIWTIIGMMAVFVVAIFANLVIGKL